MSLTQIRVHRPVTNAISLLLLFGVTSVVLFVAMRSPLKDDIAWLLYVARRWLAGRELYVDVIEVNPPLIIWISAIPLTIARWLALTPQSVAMPFFAAIVLACAWWSACLLRPIGGLFAARIPVFATVGATLMIVPAADLGQREHLLVAAFLPYLILFARGLSPRSSPQPAYATAAAVGVLAGLGCALKPQYCLAFAALEAVALGHRMRPWRVAPVAAAATLAFYVGFVAFVCPAYLRQAVPLALALYGATDVSLPVLLLKSALLLGAEAVAVVLWLKDRKTQPYSGAHAGLLLTGIVFAAISSAIVFIDGKDWFYHRLPASVVTLLVLLVWAAVTVRRTAFAGGDEPSHGRRAALIGLVAAGIVVGWFGVSAAQRLRPEVEQAVEPQTTTVARLEALIRLHHARTYIAFSEWIALGFPVVNNTGVIWASRFDSMWALKGELWRAHIDPVAAKAWPIAHWVAHDFLAGCPDIAVVDMRERLNYIGILSAADPAFARAWSGYKQIVAFDGLRVFKRGKSTTCIAPWIAAQGPGNGITIR